MNLQLAQRDFLESFSYNLEMPNPQAYLDELYLSLPMLRKVVNYEGGWADISAQTWESLLVAVRRKFTFRTTVESF